MLAAIGNVRLLFRHGSGLDYFAYLRNGNTFYTYVPCSSIILIWFATYWSVS